MSASKTIVSDLGTFIVGNDVDEESLDLTSMLPEASPLPVSSPSPREDLYLDHNQEQITPRISDKLIVNNEVFSGTIVSFSVRENKLTGKKIIKVVLRSPN